MTASELDCTRCGACCFGTHPKYIALLPEDRARAIPEDVTSQIDGRRYMTLCGGHCAQLTATPDARLVCAIYDERPEACRAFRAGSFECGKARQHRLHLAEALRLPVAIPTGLPVPEMPLVAPAPLAEASPTGGSEGPSRPRAEAPGPL